MKESFNEQSRLSWRRGDGEQPNIEQRTFGCLQRIASATETMAKSYVDLEKDRDRWERMCRDAWEREETLRHSKAALRGHITRLKKRLAESPSHEGTTV